MISEHIPSYSVFKNIRLLEFQELASALPRIERVFPRDTLTQPDFYIFPLSGALRKKTNKWTSKPGSHEKSDAYTHSQIV